MEIQITYTNLSGKVQKVIFVVTVVGHVTMAVLKADDRGLGDAEVVFHYRSNDH